MTSIQNFLKNYFQLFKFLALPFFVILLISTHLDQVLNESIEGQLRSSEGAGASVWFLAGLSLLLSLAVPWILQMIGLMGFLATQKKLQISSFLKKNSEYLAIETLRAWGKMVLYSLLLILPGIWKFFQYQLLPWVVCLSKKYNEGQIDALETSARLFQKKKWLIILLSLAFLILWPVLASLIFDQNQLFWISPGKSLIYHLIETMIHVLFIQIMTRIFVGLLQEENHESILQLEGN